MVDIVRLVDIDTDAFRMEDGSVLKTYTWFCHIHEYDMNSLTMHTTESDAARAALAHIEEQHDNA